jgi:hypothetical protein
VSFAAKPRPDTHDVDGGSRTHGDRTFTKPQQSIAGETPSRHAASCVPAIRTNPTRGVVGMTLRSRAGGAPAATETCLFLTAGFNRDLVDSRLHRRHGDHCEDHGPVAILARPARWLAAGIGPLQRLIGLVSNGSTPIIAEPTADRIPEDRMPSTNRPHDAA